MRDTVAAKDILADLGELTNDTYEDIDDVVAYCRALRDGHSDEEARQIASEEKKSNSPASGVARGYVERLQQMQTRLGRIASDLKGDSNRPPQQNTAYKLVLRAMNDVEYAMKMLERSS